MSDMAFETEDGVVANAAGSNQLEADIVQDNTVSSIYDSIYNAMPDEIPLDPEEEKEESQEEQQQVEENTTSETPEQTEPKQQEEDIPALPDGVSYEDFYKEMMSPIKANGKTISLQSAQEARQLIQMGANYTKKMQELAPQRKIVEYLKQNNFSDPNQVTFLVDLAKGNPSAVQKWMQDTKVDLNSIGSPQYDDDGNELPVNYVPSSYMPTDESIALQDILNEVTQTQSGVDIITASSTWDTDSKALLHKNPGILRDLAIQKQAGIFDIINNEIERRKAVGSIPLGMPYIQAYKNVGEALEARGYFNNLQQTTPAQSNVVSKPYIQGTQNTMQTNTNVQRNQNQQAKSAGLTRMSNSSPKTTTKDAAMRKLYNDSISGNLSGEEFEKQFNKLFGIS